MMAHRTRIITAFGAFIALIAVLLGYGYLHYGTEVRYKATGHRLVIAERNVAGLGKVLVSNTGYPLYAFAPDQAQKVTCSGECAFSWPPVTVPAADTVTAGDRVNPAMLGTDAGPGGERVATYHGWPLYTYLGDTSPMHATGQGVNDSGGLWYVIRPSGQLVR